MRLLRLPRPFSCPVFITINRINCILMSYLAPKILNNYFNLGRNIWISFHCTVRVFLINCCYSVLFASFVHIKIYILSSSEALLFKDLENCKVKLNLRKVIIKNNLFYIYSSNNKWSIFCCCYWGTLVLGKIKEFLQLKTACVLF